MGSGTRGNDDIFVGKLFHVIFGESCQVVNQINQIFESHQDDPANLPVFKGQEPTVNEQSGF